MVQGPGFRVQGSGFRVQGAGCVGGVPVVGQDLLGDVLAGGVVKREPHHVGHILGEGSAFWVSCRFPLVVFGFRVSELGS